MTKHVTFNDNVEVREMSIDLSQHRQEVKSPKQTVQNPVNVSTYVGDSDKKDYTFLWVLLLIVIVVILLYLYKSGILGV